MRLGLLTACVMVAFAANSVLNRAALGDGATGALEFAAIRLAAGAVMLCALALARGGAARMRKALGVTGPAALLLYMIGFSLAYLKLDSGVGALILFGGVQLTMFAGGVLTGERPPALRWAGAGVALAGLAWMVWPAGPTVVAPGSALLMGAAALGWGIYSLHGRRAGDPLAASAMNFALAAPVAVLILLAWPGASLRVDATGALLAGVSGALTSGLGYAVWYAVLPRLDASIAAVSQLTVPVIAMLGGGALLAERITPDVALPALLVLGGVALGLRRRA